MVALSGFDGLVHINVETWDTIGGMAAGRGDCAVSANATWIACKRDQIGVVAPLSRLRDSRNLIVDGDGEEVYMWRSAGGSPWLVDSLRIGAPVDTLPVGVPFQLGALALTAAGERTIVPFVQWRSLDTNRANVDSAGTVRPKGAGRVTIEASLGGWRTARMDLLVVEDSARVLLDEAWDSSRVARWTMFGHPRASVVDREGSQMLSINGDDEYFSGAYSRYRFSWRRGVGMELDVSMRLTRFQWQLIIGGFFALAPDSSLAKWNDSTGYLPGFSGAPGCAYQFPLGETRANAARFHSEYLERLPADTTGIPYMADGRWYRVRIQMLPDSRCGIAVNGVPVWISSTQAGAVAPLSAIVQGSAEGTRILVRRVRIWEGVDAGVNWSAIGTWREVPGIHR